MSDSEKWAWWTLGVLATTIASYFIFCALLGHGLATLAVFALLGLAALPGIVRGQSANGGFDEREREIANKALRAGFTAFWVAFVALLPTIGLIKGWDASVTVPVWGLAEAIWWAAILVMGVEAATTLVLYRVGTDA